MKPLNADTSTDNGEIFNLGWYNQETGEWDKPEPDIANFVIEDKA